VRYLAVLLHLADLAGAHGEVDEAEQSLRTVLRLDPCHEEAAARLMGVLVAADRAVEALRVYHELAMALSRDLDAVPSADLEAVRAECVARQKAPVAAALPLRLAAPSRPTNLPRALSSFVGRACEQGEIRRLLAESRLLTLVGPGGCGKTRLALYVADGLVDAYQDGVWLVQLGALPASDHDRMLVPRAVARALGAREQPGEILTTTLTAFLAPRRILLILDNCEHLLASCAALTLTLLASCPQVQILATSREQLGVPGELLFAVPSLAVPPADVQPDALLQHEAAALFLSRAKGKPGSVVEASAAGAIARICRRLDGMPLAIELAAARASVLPVEVLAARLDDSFRVLGAGPRTGLPRQRTLRATFDWSVELLAERERVLLRRLAVFAGGWSLEAAEAVCPDLPSQPPVLTSPRLAADEVLDLLGALVSKSLVLFEVTSGEARYRFLEPIRQYAAEALDAAGERCCLGDRHLDWCTRLVERAEPALWGGPEQEGWLAQLEYEHDNCRAALRWAQEGKRTERGLRLAGALRRFWDVRGYRAEGYDWLESLLQAAEDDQSVAAATRAKALVAAATLAYGLNKYDQATARAEQVRGLYRGLGDREGLADAFNVLGMVASDREDLDGAARWYSEALALYRSLGMPRRIAAMVCNLGNVGFFRADYAEAVARYEQAAGLFRALDDAVALSSALSNMGAALTARGDLARAEHALQESIRSALQAGAVVEVSQAQSNLADVMLRNGDYARALDLLRQSTAGMQRSTDKRGTAILLGNLAEAMAGVGQVGPAATICGAILAYCAAVGIGTSSAEWGGLRRALDLARARLGEPGFAAAYTAGQGRTLDEAVSLALDEHGFPSMSAPSGAAAEPWPGRLRAVAYVRVHKRVLNVHKRTGLLSPDQGAATMQRRGDAGSVSCGCLVK
jgi:non-specific serine/threonine protein kinase